MKKVDSPLLMAMKMRMDRKDHPTSSPMTTFGRTIQVHHSEVPSLARAMPGDKMQMMVHGVVKSVHDDGHSIVEVHKVGAQEIHKEPKAPIIHINTGSSIVPAP